MLKKNFKGSGSVHGILKLSKSRIQRPTNEFEELGGVFRTLSNIYDEAFW